MIQDRIGHRPLAEKTVEGNSEYLTHGEEFDFFFRKQNRKPRSRQNFGRQKSARNKSRAGKTAAITTWI